MIQARNRGSLLKAFFSVVLLTYNNLLLLIQFILISRIIFPLTERVRFVAEICWQKKKNKEVKESKRFYRSVFKWP